MRNWIAQLSQMFRQSGRRVAHRSRRVSFRPTLEALEERRVLSTYTVSNTLTSGTGSLAQAITDANNNAGFDEIDFAIGSGPVKINLTSALPVITDPVYINGTSQPGYTDQPLVEINGTKVIANGTCFDITGGGSTVRGLAINNFKDGAAITLEQEGGNVVAGNVLGTSPGGTVAKGNDYGVLVFSTDNTIGGLTAADRNLISGNSYGVFVSGTGTDGNVIEGNYIGTDKSGTAALPNTYGGVLIEYRADQNTVGGTTPAARNVISGNDGPGVWLLNSNDNVVEGNYIGTDKTGTVALGNATTVISDNHVNVDAGVLVQDNENNTSGNTIGGTQDDARNLISGNLRNGVAVDGDVQDTLIQHNYVGTAKDGVTALRNSGNGVLIDGADFTTVLSNTIAFNSKIGVDVLSGTQNPIRYNLIFSNSGLGIDLGGDGVTPNDDLDADTGANELQNYPTFTAANSGGVTTVTGSLSSAANQVYSLQFFFSVAADPSGYGEGQTYTGTTISVTTNSSGVASFSQGLGVLVPQGEFVTATATDHMSNTSEFSAAVAVQ